jgi:hypothetical protein
MTSSKKLLAHPWSSEFPMQQGFSQAAVVDRILHEFLQQNPKNYVLLMSKT